MGFFKKNRNLSEIETYFFEIETYYNFDRDKQA